MRRVSVPLEAPHRGKEELLRLWMSNPGAPPSVVQPPTADNDAEMHCAGCRLSLEAEIDLVDVARGAQCVSLKENFQADSTLVHC